MRIILWSTAFWPHVGGVEVLGANFVAGMRERGHELLVITDRDMDGMTEREVVAGTDVVRIEFRRAIERRDLRGVAAARAAATRERSAFAPDIDHVFHAGPELMVMLAARTASPAPLVFTFHLAPGDELLDAGSGYGQALRAADWVTTCSQATLEDVSARAGGLPRASVILNALPPPSGAEPPPPPPEPVLLFLGRLNTQKGFDLGLRALAELRSGRPALRAIVAGDGAERESLQRLARELGVADAVEFTGWVAPVDVPALMARSSIVVMPSRWEPFGLVALEAAQNGRPVLGFAVDGLIEAAPGPDAATLVEPEDLPALTAGLASLLDDPGLVARMGRRARELAAGGDAWDRHLDQYEDLFQRLVAGD